MSKARYTLSTELNSTKSNVSGTKLTATSCRIHAVADLLTQPATMWTVSATKLNVYGNSRLCCRFRQQSTFNKVDRVEFNFVASVYRALHHRNINNFCKLMLSDLAESQLRIYYSAASLPRLLCCCCSRD